MKAKSNSVKTKTVAVVPINALISAKSRLAAYMAETDRRALVLWMAGGVLAALRASGAIERIAVVSPDAQVLRWAREHGAQPLLQRDSGLNAGLEQGRRWAYAMGADALLILLADLPCLASDEVAMFVRRGEASPIVLAPDRREQGTNGLLVHLDGQSCGSELLAHAPSRGSKEPRIVEGVRSFPFAFGVDSLSRHRALARERGIEPDVFTAPGLRFDVDTPADLAMLYEYGIWMPGDHDDYPDYRGYQDYQDYHEYPVGAGEGNREMWP
jgi:2-phospho-L-lactate guanylyltransferase